ncbi:MAG: hypothetical protein H8E25_12915 [Planctomycetes bacterium]|nr:hypothetical protein [Planctomycetota bacterium]
MLLTLLLVAPLQSTAPIDGTWRATVGSHEAVLALKSCADGELIGILPAEPTISITGGTVNSSNVTINFSGEDGGGAIGDFSFAGVLSGDVLDGQGLVDGTLLDITFNRVTANYEVQFIELIDPDVSSVYPNVGATLFFNVVTLAGRFIGGGFSGFHSCEFIACGGVIESLSIDPSTGEYTIATNSSNITGELIAIWDSATDRISGTWTSLTSSGLTNNGEFMGGQQGVAASDNFDEVLGLLTTFADGVESETLLASDIFDAAYMNDGVTATDWDARFGTWFADYDNLQVDVGPITTLITHNTGDEEMYVRRLPQIEATVTVSGLNVISGATEIVYEFTPSAVSSELTLITLLPTAKFIGNGAAAALEFELPFDFSTAMTSGTNVMWPYGVHGGGHPEGHGGVDIWIYPGSWVKAAAAGEVVYKDSSVLLIECRNGLLMQYEHLASIDPAITLGASVILGQNLAIPEVDHFHFGIRHGSVTEPPLGYFSAASQIEFDLLWAEAAWPQEISEPLPANEFHIAFPHVIEWVNNDPTGMPAVIELIDVSPFDYVHTYRLLDATGTPYDTGTANWDHIRGWLDFGTQLGLCDIVSDEMHLVLSTSGRPTSLSGASVFSFVE